MKTLDLWRGLQDDGYFDNHKHYVGKPVSKPNYRVRVKDKVLVEVGCGYGRQTVYFSKTCSCVYAVDVTVELLAAALAFVAEKGGRPDVVLPVEAKNVASIPDGSIDVVYSRYVFQHIAIADTKEYIDILYPKLKLGGVFDIQFLGLSRDLETIEAGKEPCVRLCHDTLAKIFGRCQKTEINPEPQPCGALHYYVLAVK